VRFNETLFASQSRKVALINKKIPLTFYRAKSFWFGNINHAWTFRIDVTGSSSHSNGSIIWCISLHGNLIYAWCTVFRKDCTTLQTSVEPPSSPLREESSHEQNAFIHFDSVLLLGTSLGSQVFTAGSCSPVCAPSSSSLQKLCYDKDV